MKCLILFNILKWFNGNEDYFLLQFSYYDAASSLYFRDGIRPIDFVIVWDEFNHETSSYRCKEMRKVYILYFQLSFTKQYNQLL